MKNHLLNNILILSVCVFVSCKTTPKATEDSVVKTDEHSSRNSLDWDGIYRGL